MVILLTPYGQRSNNLFQHVHIDSFCRENGIYFYNKFIQNMVLDYPNIGKKNKIIEMAIDMKIPQILNRIRIIKYIDFVDESKNEVHKRILLNSKIVSCDGWLFRSNDTVRKYRNVYKHVFKPNVDEEYLFESFLKKQDSNKKLVGVHIRRGDYKEFENGRYFYNDNVYIDKLQQIIQLLGEGCKVIVFSNDAALNYTLYRDHLKDVVFSKESAVADHYLMSKCDYLIGPPSTFTMWASYIGEVPLYHIEQANDAVVMDSFRVLYG
jgi:hypothetical protein